MLKILSAIIEGSHIQSYKVYVKKELKVTEKLCYPLQSP